MPINKYLSLSRQECVGMVNNSWNQNYKKSGMQHDWIITKYNKVVAEKPSS